MTLEREVARFKTLARYWNTLRYLRHEQIVGRVAFRLARPRPDLAPAPELRTPTGENWTPPAPRRQSMVGPNSFDFLNVQADLTTWNDGNRAKLWLYNLHYFDDLNAQGADERRNWHEALIARWIVENPAAGGNGWEPYPTSLRIVNWIKYALSGSELSPAALSSLAIQTRWLVQRIEWHLLGNHLFSNGKALLFAGRFFSGPEADAWTRLGRAIIDRELPEQICTDGGHFERSTMYHALAFEDVLDLANLAVTFGDHDLHRRASSHIAPMRAWLASMSHPDGEIGLFNDAAFGIAPTRHALEAYADRLGFAPITVPLSLPQSGYERVEIGTLLTLLDVAPIGPDYLPAHGHADAFSFEMSLFGQRVLVNSGTSVYAAGPERSRQRGTAAHNTVVIDGEDSSEVWGSFRVARRARIHDLHRADGLLPEPSTSISARHDGYHRLPGRPTHSRSWHCSATSLVVEDTIVGQYRSAVAHLHFHPAVAVSQADNELSIVLPEGQVVRLSVEGGSVELSASTWHPEFGTSVPSQKLTAVLAGPRLRTILRW